MVLAIDTDDDLMALADLPRYVSLVAYSITALHSLWSLCKGWLGEMKC